MKGLPNVTPAQIAAAPQLESEDVLVRLDLMLRAQRRFGTIYPCSGRTFDQCFTVRDGQLTLWFNDGSGSTHVVSTAA